MDKITLLKFQVCFEVSFTTPSYVFIMLQFIWSIRLWIFGSVHMIYKCSMILLSVIFVLENTKVHVGIMNSGDVTANIEASIDEQFYI